MLMFCVILLAAKEISDQPMTVGVFWSFIGAAIPLLVGFFYASRAFVSKKDLNDALKTKLDESKFDGFKDVFEEFQAQVWDEAKKHEMTNELTYKLIRDDMKEYRKEQVENAKMLNEINTNLRIAINDIKWLRTNSNKQ